MINRFITFFLGVAVAVYASKAADASITVETGDWVVISTNGTVHYGGGGEFLVTVYGENAFTSTGAVNASYQDGVLGEFFTFCADLTRYIVLDKPYLVTSLANSSFQQTLGAQIFAAFSADGSVPSGSLSGYVPGPTALATTSSFDSMTSQQVAAAIQDEIWHSLGFNYQHGFHDLAESIFHWSTTLPSSTTTVEQMGLEGPNGNYGYGNPAQAMLYVPPAGQVPEPATCIVWSLFGGMGIAGIRLRRKMSARCARTV